MEKGLRFSVFCTEEVGHGWTLLIKMAEVTLIDFLYLNRLIKMAEVTLIDFSYINRPALLSFTEVGSSFHIKVQGWDQS